MTASDSKNYEKNFSFSMIPAGNAFSNLRAVKNEYELSLMKKAQEITDAAFADVLNHIHAGMTEREIRAELIYCLYRHGGDALSFDPVVVGGPNSSLPHGHATDRPVSNGEFLTMDFGVLYGGYCSDMTRTVCIGKPTDEMKNIYDIVLEAQLLGLKTAKAGLHWGRECDGVVREFISNHGYGPNFGHGLGHGLGIEVHESLDFDPDLPGIAPENGVVSVEPGIYLEGKFGVRIEDCVILKADGNENMTKSPKELICL
ncbi:MAG: M24 family metallopeptidase [Clostridia bacterium]|nr:M24 family metallopeptidase [Clostridia bacterium]